MKKASLPFETIIKLVIVLVFLVLIGIGLIKGIDKTQRKSLDLVGIGDEPIYYCDQTDKTHLCYQRIVGKTFSRPDMGKYIDTRTGEKKSYKFQCFPKDPDTCIFACECSEEQMYDEDDNFWEGFS